MHWRTLLVATVCVAVLVLAQPPAASASPTVSVSQTTHLETGQTVTVSGSGMPPSGTVFVGMCPAGATTPYQCNTETAIAGTAAPDGTYSVQLRISRYIRTTINGAEEFMDCFDVACTVAATDFASVVSTPVSFDDVDGPDTITFGPTTNLIGGTVRVTGSDVRPSVLIEIMQCGDHTEGVICDRDPQKTLTTTPTGTFAQFAAVERVLTVNGSTTKYVDCATTDCWLRVITPDALVEAPLTFVKPAVSYSFETITGLDDTRKVATPVATISCSSPTYVSLIAVTSQGGFSGRYRLAGQPCSPSAPLKAWLPTYDTEGTGTFVPGQAQVHLQVWTHYTTNPDLPASVISEADGTTQLFDGAVLEPYFRAALEGPDGPQVLAALQDAIRTRVAQDPIFRAWFAQFL